MLHGLLALEGIVVGVGEDLFVDELAAFAVVAAAAFTRIGVGGDAVDRRHLALHAVGGGDERRGAALDHAGGAEVGRERGE